MTGHFTEKLVVDCVPDDIWHKTMNEFWDSHYEQTAIYESGQKRERSSHILLKRDGIPVGGARVGLYIIPGLKRGLALVRFGPFWRHVKGETDTGVYKTLIRTLIDEYCKRRKLYLIVRPRAHPDFYPVEAKTLGDLGVAGSSSSMLDRYFVDLALDEEEQKNSLEQKWRHNLRKGMAHSLEIRIGDDAAAIKTFQAIYAQMVQRKNLNYPGVELPAFIPELVGLPNRMKMLIALAYNEGQPIGGLAFSVVGDIAYYVFGASNDKAIELNAGYVLQWHVIRWLREHGGARWYELGGPGDPGIRQFKKGLAGKRGALLALQEFHYCPDVMARFVVGGLFALRDARDSIQRWQRERKPSLGRLNN
ncbi:MAG: GNAT family N-acetyltransferase [Bradyrhizobiaceae bacterium]|nr:MAG: GNAT family N-acetyltransferase [Bradyrhizobiaceae bacterium]